MTEDWSIDLDGDYKRDIVDGQLRFTAPGRTIWLQVWRKPDFEVAHTLTWIKADARHAHPKDAEEFEEIDAAEARHASWYSEPGTRGIQHSLYGYTIRPGTYIQSAFISDVPADRDWALNGGVRFGSTLRRSSGWELASPPSASLRNVSQFDGCIERNPTMQTTAAGASFQALARTMNTSATLTTQARTT